MVCELWIVLFIYNSPAIYILRIAFGTFQKLDSKDVSLFGIFFFTVCILPAGVLHLEFAADELCLCLLLIVNELKAGGVFGIRFEEKN